MSAAPEGAAFHTIPLRLMARTSTFNSGRLGARARLPVADILAKRGYGLKADEEDPRRSIVALCPIDFSDTEDGPLPPEEIFEVISSGSRLLLIPNVEGHEQHRAIET